MDGPPVRLGVAAVTSGEAQKAVVGSFAVIAGVLVYQDIRAAKSKRGVTGGTDALTGQVLKNHQDT